MNWSILHAASMCQWCRWPWNTGPNALCRTSSPPCHSWILRVSCVEPLTLSPIVVDCKSSYQESQYRIHRLCSKVIIVATGNRDGPIPIPNIRYHRYWFTQWWYRYVQAVSTCFETCVCRTAHVLSLHVRFHMLCHLRLPPLNMFLGVLTCSCSWTRTFE